MSLEPPPPPPPPRRKSPFHQAYKAQPVPLKQQSRTVNYGAGFYIPPHRGGRGVLSKRDDMVEELSMHDFLLPRGSRPGVSTPSSFPL